MKPGPACHKAGAPAALRWEDPGRTSGAAHLNHWRLLVEGVAAGGLGWVRRGRGRGRLGVGGVMSRRPSRRTVLGLAGVAAGFLAGCSRGIGQNGGPPHRRPVRRRLRAAPTATTSVRRGPATVVSTPTASPAAGPDITHGPRTVNAVALTFHGDGPESIVRETIAVLRKAGAQVTVLAIGRWLAANPDLAALIRDAGHELGNHTWSHRTMPRLTRRRCAPRSTARPPSSTGSPVAPGAGSAPAAPPAARQRSARPPSAPGTAPVWATTSTRSTTPTPDRTRSSARSARSVRPGSIVSLHLGHPGTLVALPAVLAHLTTGASPPSRHPVS